MSPTSDITITQRNGKGHVGMRWRSQSLKVCAALSADLSGCPEFSRIRWDCELSVLGGMVETSAPHHRQTIFASYDPGLGRRTRLMASTHRQCGRSRPRCARQASYNDDLRSAMAPKDWPMATSSARMKTLERMSGARILLRSRTLS